MNALIKEIRFFHVEVPVIITIEMSVTPTMRYLAINPQHKKKQKKIIPKLK